MMAKSKRDAVNKASEQAAFVESEKKAEERWRRRRYTPMTKAQFRYWVMRDLGMLEEYYDDARREKRGN